MFDNFPTGNSSFYILICKEKEEIKKLKWLESEKVGKDIGYDHAFWIWNMQYRKKWLQEMKKNTIELD